MQNTVRTVGITLVLLLGFIGTTAAQPDTRSKETPPGMAPKALNPQPEVPSKPKLGLSDQTDPKSPKALNPQPEVPSKPKAKKKPPKPPKAD